MDSILNLLRQISKYLNNINETYTGATSGAIADERLSSNVVTLTGAQSITNKKFGSLTTNGYVKVSGGDGTPSVALDTSGSFSGTGSSTSSFTVTIGNTQAGTTYKVIVTPTNQLSATDYYVTTKTTTAFTVAYLTPKTGTVAFDWKVIG